MLNPFIFVLNTVIICAVMTFLPSIAFAVMNASNNRWATLAGKW